MRLLVTGASGFLGRYVVAEALRRGHEVRAIVRPASRSHLPVELRDKRIEIAELDLRAPSGVQDALDGVDAVLHLAASKAGDMYTQYAGTVIATEALLGAMVSSDVRRIVAISSFSVYDYLRKSSYTTLDERSRLEREFPPRDAYSHTKLVQERLIVESAQQHGWDYAILRPGVIYGPDNLWTARLGMSANDKRWLRIGWRVRLPLSYVENCAEAIVLAAEKTGPLALTLNVLDDDPPTQARYVRVVRNRMKPRPRSMTVPVPVVRVLARMAWITNGVFFRGRAKLPSILIPASLHARFKSLRYSNARLRKELDWAPRYSLEEAIDRTLSSESAEGRP